MSDRPSQAKCEIRYNEDGSIDEVIVYDHKGRCLVHLEDMGNWFWMGIGCAGFCLTPNGKFEGKKAVKLSMSWAPDNMKGHRPKGT